MLDVLIRDGSDNRRSLDDVMRELYRSTYKQGRGFTANDWWPAVSRAAGGRSFAEFDARYIDGREPFPWSDVLPRAGLRQVRTRSASRCGLAAGQDSAGRSWCSGAAGRRGPGGRREGRRPLLALGDLAIMDPDFGTAFRARFGKNEGDSLPIRVRRGTDTLTLHGIVRLVARVETSSRPTPTPSEKAERVRNGIFTGRGK